MIKRSVLWVLAGMVLAGCGSGATPEPESAAVDEKKPKAEAADDATEEKSEKAAKADEPEVPKATPESIITDEDTIFMLSFNDSDFGKAENEKCAKKSGDDPAKKAACVTKAQKAFDGDGIRFRKDAQTGKWVYMTFGKLGGKIADLHKIEFEVDAQTGTQITLKLRGPDRGAKPGTVPPKLVIEVPSEFQIEITDPQKGKLVYKARVGAEGTEDTRAGK
jgi:hypothetical protein